MGNRENRRAVRVLASILSPKVVIAASVLATVACAGEPARSADEFRCRVSVSGGGCYSMPANCPVTLNLGHSTEPRCPLGADLIPAEEDDCASKQICID